MPSRELMNRIIFTRELRADLRQAGVTRHMTPVHRKGQSPKLVINRHRDPIAVVCGDGFEIGLDVQRSQKVFVEYADPQAVDLVIAEVKKLLA